MNQLVFREKEVWKSDSIGCSCENNLVAYFFGQPCSSVLCHIGVMYGVTVKQMEGQEHKVIELNYTVVYKKTRHQTLVHNFAK